MHSIITSYLLQSKKCVLQGIGSLQLIESPATVASEPDRIQPPYTEIIFKSNGKSSDGLVNYVSAVNKIPVKEADDMLNNFCKEWKQKIDNGENLHLETIGSIKKNNSGEIIFEREESVNFYEPLEVDQLYKPELTNTHEAKVDAAVDEPYIKEEVVVERSYWGLWALILFAIAAVMIFYHFKENGFNRSSIGNQNKFVIDSTQETYKTGR